jgi:hypothetical protein
MSVYMNNPTKQGHANNSPSFKTNQVTSVWVNFSTEHSPSLMHKISESKFSIKYLLISNDFLRIHTLHVKEAACLLSYAQYRNAPGAPHRTAQPSCIQTLHISSFIGSVRLSTDTKNTLDMQSRDIKMRSLIF